MKLYSQNENYKLYNGDMNDLNGVIESNSIDAIVTDPPYEINFMGRHMSSTMVLLSIGEKMKLLMKLAVNQSRSLKDLLGI